jgi:hypothetical protein
LGVKLYIAAFFASMLFRYLVDAAFRSTYSQSVSFAAALVAATTFASEGTAWLNRRSFDGSEKSPGSWVHVKGQESRWLKAVVTFTHINLFIDRMQQDAATFFFFLR